MADRFLLLRCPAGNGRGERDWAIGVIADGLVVRFGGTGRPMQMREIPSSKWTNGNAESEAHKRIRDQMLGDGYAVVGTCGFDADGAIIDLVEDTEARLPLPDGSTAAPRRRPTVSSKLFWEVQAPSWDAFRLAMEAASAGLPVTWVTRQGLPSGLPMLDRWSPDLRHRGLGPVKEAGALPANATVNTVLWWFALREKGTAHGVTVALADTTGRELLSLRREDAFLGEFGSSFAAVRELAEDHGIIPKEVFLGEIRDIEDLYF